MGNCWGSSSAQDSTSHFYSSTNMPTTLATGTSNNSSNNVEFSATSSTNNCRSQFSGTVSQIEEGGQDGWVLEIRKLKAFTLVELKMATRNFRPDELLGAEHFGRVFKGWVDEKTLTPSKVGSGMAVIIKRVTVLNHGSIQGLKEWLSEVNFLGGLSHPNLVKLLGYCSEDNVRFLVYEYMQKGSLETCLFRRNQAIEPLSWELRLKIVIGAARGLAFLNTSGNVIFRDFKISNILLDGNYNAKLSDFGLLELETADGGSHMSTRVMGTYGYAAPEYIATGHLTVKSNVYGFGVVLLEMMTGLRALDKKRPVGQQNLVDWLKPTLSKKRKLKNIMDMRIQGQYSSKAAIQLAELSLKCLDLKPTNRPSMEEVVEALERIESLDKKKAQVFSKSSSSATPSHGQDQQSTSNLDGFRKFFQWGKLF